MTHPEFIQLQKDVFRQGEKWLNLIALWNRHHAHQLDPNRRSTYITILRSIATKNDWEFKPIDIYQYFPTEQLDKANGVTRTI